MPDEPPDKTKDESWTRALLEARAQLTNTKSEADKTNDSLEKNPDVRASLDKEHVYDHSSPPNVPNMKKPDDGTARRERALPDPNEQNKTKSR